MARKIKREKTLQVSNSDPVNKTANLLMSLPERIISFRPNEQILSRFRNKTTYIILLIVGVLLLAMFKKDWFIAAMVNGTPITNLELQQKLNKQFKSQVLNQLINEKIILQEAARLGIVPHAEEIKQRISEIETRVGGKKALDTLLVQQNTTIESLSDQLRLELIVSKLYEKEATVSSEEIQKFIENNKAILQSTDSASLEKEAEDTIKQQKLSQIFSQKFKELRQKANIKIF